MIHVQTSIGTNLKVTVTGENVKEVIKNASFFTTLPQKCPLCDSAVHLNYRSPKEFHYYGLRCVGPTTHECNFGAHKEGGTLFYKGTDSWHEAKFESSGGGDTQQESAPVAAGGVDDDIPF